MTIQQQLYNELVEQMKTHYYASGAKLPSVRELAHLKGVSRSTVELVYSQLVAEGFVDAQARRGLFVKAIDDLFLHREIAPITLLEEQPVRSLRYTFSYGSIDQMHFPHKKWRRYVMNALDEAQHLPALSGPRQGHYELRCEIAKYVKQARGIDCQPEQIWLTGGTQQAISLLCQTVLRPCNAIGMEHPGYDKAQFIFAQWRRSLTPLSIDEQGAQLPAQLTNSACYVTPSHQFPLGMVMSLERRLQWLQWAHTTNSFIIEDDYDSEFRYASKPIPALKSLDRQERVIYLGTFSKLLLPSLRASFIIFPPSVIEQFRSQLLMFLPTVAHHVQLALTEFLRVGDWGRHIRKMRQLYMKKNALLVSSLHHHAPLPIIGAGAGLHLLVQVPSIKSEHEWISEAALNDVALFPTSPFYWHTPSETTKLMIGFGGIPIEQIESGIAAWLAP